MCDPTGLPRGRQPAARRGPRAQEPGAGDPRRHVDHVYRWPSVGWCVGVIKEANKDKRFKMNGKVINFNVYYELDDDALLADPARQADGATLA